MNLKNNMTSHRKKLQLRGDGGKKVDSLNMHVVAINYLKCLNFLFLCSFLSLSDGLFSILVSLTSFPHYGTMNSKYFTLLIEMTQQDLFDLIVRFIEQIFARNKILIFLQ